MATESEPREPPESTASSPISHSATNRELKAAKDRNCPFCGQAFTSSSLGRHLDLYIKPKNPKPADGVHDVDEIKRIRGGITRRQPRTSLKGEGEEREEGQKRGNSEAWSRSEEDGGGSKRRRTDEGRGTGVEQSPVRPSPTEQREGGTHVLFNTANWQATGVINNLPARAPSRSQNATPVGYGQAQRTQEMRRDAVGNRIERPEYGVEDTWKTHEAAEIGKAAEMALREVLGSLEAARKKVEPKQLYEEFDFFKMAFPGLCLAILPPPSTLFTSTPFGAVHTWSLTPPGEKQYEAVARMVNERVAWLWKGNRDNLPESAAFKHIVHLQGAWEHWHSMSDQEKTSAWNLELSRAYVSEKGRSNDLRQELDHAQQRIQHLEAEYDRLSRCQLPREYLLHPPKTMPVTPGVMREMRTSHSHTAAAEADYDAEALLEKWKTAVRSTARPAKQHTASSSAPHMQPYIVETQRNPMRGDIVLNGSMFGIGGPLPRDAEGAYEAPHTTGTVGTVVDTDNEAGTEKDAEKDAEGEADGGQEGAHEDGEQRNGTAVMRSRNGRRRLDPASMNGKGEGPKMYKEQHIQA